MDCNGVKTNKSNHTMNSKHFLGIYIIYWFASRYYYYGFNGLVDIFWVCNISLLLSYVCLHLRLYNLLHIVGLSMSCGLLLWIWDGFSLIFFNKSYFGVFTTNIPIAIRIATLHHVFLVPLCQYEAKSVHISKMKSIIGLALVSSWVFVLSKLLIPEYVEIDGVMQQVNVNAVKRNNFFILNKLNDQHWIVYCCTFGVTFSLLNHLAFFVIVQCQRIIFWMYLKSKRE